MKIAWTQRAARHLEAAFVYWSEEESPSAGDVMLDRIFSLVEMLKSFPEAGRPGRIPGTRELVITRTPFLVGYRIRGDLVEILTVFHGARKWPPRL